MQAAHDPMHKCGFTQLILEILRAARLDCQKKKKRVKDVDMTINELGLNYSKCVFIKLPDVVLSQFSAIKFYTITALLN